MTCFYLTGQNNFGNRGCEALVRSTVAGLKDQFPDATFIVPSHDIGRDSAQWREAAMCGVRFVPAPTIPQSYRQWGRLCRLVPLVKSFSWPSLSGLASLDDHLQECDVVVSIGGDNYSIDYGLVSLFFFVGIAERAIELGKTVALWGASIGPFSEEPRVEKIVAEHLRRLHMVSVRESHTLRYLESIQVSDTVIAVADPAFQLRRQAVAADAFWPEANGDGVLGLNMSPLIEKYMPANDSGSAKNQTASFLRWVLSNTDLSVLLIPHVAALDGARYNNDQHYLEEVLRMVDDHSGRIRIVPAGLNACQLKDIIARCRFFIAARMHAAIAALSSCVPTVSIAYSVKSRGVNLDLFGHEKYVVASPDLSASTLKSALLQLVADETAIRKLLVSLAPEWRLKAEHGARELAAIVRRLSEAPANENAIL